MARIAKPHEVAAKRNAILDAAQRLVFTKGYEQMSIQDVLADLQISGGAFHHYFDSRGALLEALIQRIERDSSRPLLPIVHDPGLNAIEKLKAFLEALDRLRVERKREVIAALRVWYTDGNVVVRQRVDEAIFEQRAPLLAEIIRQGIQEGVFNATFPEQTGGVVVALLQAMGDEVARMLLMSGGKVAQREWTERIVTTQAAYMEAIERVLGAPANSLLRAEEASVQPWVTALEQS